MPIRVLVVDDSSFFRRRVSEIIDQDPDLTVVDTALNGKDALDKTIKLKPDVITMDVEMPIMDGISSVREIMKKYPTPILMFSSLTHDGAQATLDALDAGALDFLPKKFEDIARNKEEAVSLLQTRIKQISKRRISMRMAALKSAGASRFATRSQRAAKVEATEQAITATSNKDKLEQIQSRRKNSNRGSASYKLMAIGTSTGGPVALQTILTKLPKNFPVPILLIQHMPAAFTSAFAARLDSMCQISVKEASNGDMLRAGCAYLAPGGKQMIVEGVGTGAKILIKEDNSDRLTYKPSVDITFASVGKAFRGHVLGVILTGMGADGRDGAKFLKQQGATIWAQDEDSCVVYGMPQAVANAGISSESIALNQMADRIIGEFNLQ
ncbi:chemotaxis-specific protein-glutamate methyltransferase [Catenovulum agarivorans DS-2]|uniref:Protein-glutamate methylesterase/protein-glutamine glutaminase n=1 Tax=Catenovulum agarivorans DS-2 TaxID=1328313 RepID=W7QKH0_9ALTE|nr:chemotaxis response regulator protein-glutamate methylesterase [Catenovulum agarivorans]EWH09457.1 chemotaxis-specific protein-glutamate methyltransferase [Catenovulum agarivorans DS-2]